MICLQNLCLSLIAEEFESFHFAFEVSNNENLKRELEFLQRKYSYELGSELLKKKKLKGEYLEFLLNEHLTFLDEQWLRLSRYRNRTKDVFCRLPNLTKLSCIQINDEILKNVAKFCPKVVQIDGFCSSNTDHGVTFLCKNEKGSVPCPQLKSISLNLSTVTYEGVAYLIRNLRCLEKIDHEGVPLALYYLHKDDLPNPEKIPGYNLVELDFDMLYGRDSLPAYYNDLLKICFTACPKLKSLRCSISGEDQLNSFNNTCLEDLRITFPDEKINVDSFLKNCGSKLVSLDVCSCIISISELAISSPKLKYLTLRDVTFPDDHGDSKTDFHRLISCTFFKIEDNRESHKAVSSLLSFSPNLEDVTFSICDLSPGTKTYILKCFQRLPLKRITFKYSAVDRNFIKDIILSCTSLKTLDLEYCSFPFDDKKELLQFAKTLSNNPCISFFEIR